MINGIYWWPRWEKDGKRTEALRVPDPWPKTVSRFEVARVNAGRGKVELISRGEKEIVLNFKDDGLGSTQVGCVLTTGNPASVPPGKQ